MICIAGSLAPEEFAALLRARARLIAILQTTAANDRLMHLAVQSLIEELDVVIEEYHRAGEPEAPATS